MKSSEVWVRGSGAVGMVAALALARLGLSVKLSDEGGVGVGDIKGGAAQPAAVSPSKDLRAFALNAASVKLLSDLKVWQALPADAKTPVHDMHIEGDQPGAALDFSAWSQGLAELAWIVDAAELDAALRAAVTYSPHVQSIEFGKTPAPAAALTVVAEGKASAARAALGVRVERHAYGHTAIAARLSSPQAHAGLARQWFRNPDVLALLPLDRPTPGHGLALVWSMPQSQAHKLLQAPEAEFVQALMDATGGAAGPLQLCSERAAWPLQLARAEAVHGPGWVLVGDAAHVVHPLAGQGLNLGLADVQALASVLAERARNEPWRDLGDVRLLARYARQRAGPNQAMAQVTDGLLQLFASQQPWLRELRNRGLSAANRLSPLKRLLVGQALGR
jgi:ubiquinone biosynthesis UbiH/UbiF/VisC/COQ6 family hydroxylase